MKAARIHDFDPDAKGPDYLRVEEVTEPEITRPDQALVRVGGAGVCRTDLHIVQGLWREVQQTELPYILGHENAGWVEEIGSAVEGVSPGDPVVIVPALGDGTCRACRRGEDNRCDNLVWQGIQIDGGYADYLVTKARNLVPLPEGMEPKAAAAYADAGLSSYHAAKRAAAELLPGDHAVVIGIGGLGHMGLQALSALCAAKIIAVDVSEEALAFAEELGADHLVQASDHTVEDVMTLTGGGAAVVLDFVAEHDVPQAAMAMLRTGGNYLVVGYGGELRTPTMAIMGQEKRITGNVGGTHDELIELLALAAEDTVRLHVREYALDDVNEALDDLSNGRIRGRGVLVPSATS